MTPLGLEMVGVEGMSESRFESGELPLLFQLVKDHRVFVDAGANCGVFTLAARSKGLHCIAIEPNQANQTALLQNLSINQFTDVEVYPIALSGKPNLLPLFGGGEGASLEVNWGGMASTYSQLVPVNTLDNVVGERFAGLPMLIKVDVEGHEFEVLQGASQLFRREPAPDWLVEHGLTENFAGRMNPHFRELFELYWEHGYRSYTADEARREVTAEDVERWMSKGSRDFGYLNYFMTKG